MKKFGLFIGFCIYAALYIFAPLIGAAYATPKPTPHPNQGQVVTEWHVVISENDVDRTMDVPYPEASPFAVDTSLVPGWTCEIRPLILEGHIRRRWVVCSFTGHQVSVRAECLDNRVSASSQEFWIGDHVSVELGCSSAVSP